MPGRFINTNNSGGLKFKNNNNSGRLTFAPPPPTYTIGQSALGGKIAYILQSGDTGYDPNQQKGLVVSSADLTAATYGCIGFTNAQGSAYGTGYQNTINILAGCSDSGVAAKICRDYNGGGYTDWFLPSTGELYKLYLNNAALGGFSGAYTGFYWSSTAYDPFFNSLAYVVSPTTGTTGGYSRSTTVNVRATRYF